MSNTYERVKQALEELGNHQDRVAQTLREEGCTGIPGHTKQCPVAVYLRKKLPEVDIMAFSNCVSWPPSSQLESHQKFYPSPVRYFIRQFDLGEYPDLNQHQVIEKEPVPS